MTAGTAASPPTRSSRHGAVWSRRRLLGGMVGLAGAGAVAAFAGLAVTGDSRLAGLRRLVRRPSVSVVMPRGGVLAGTNSALAGTIERILPDVVDAGRGRFTLDLVGFDHTLPDLTEFFAPSGAPAAERWALARARQPGPFPGSQFAALASQASAGRPADVFILTSYPEVGATPNELVAAARFVRPLDEYLGGTGSTDGEFVPSALAVCRDNGRLVGLPLTATPLLLVYDASRFDEAGVPHPESEWDWSRFFAAARRLTRDTDGDGVADQYGFFPWFRASTPLVFIWQNGGDVVSSDGRQGRLTDAAAVEAIAAVADLYRNPRVSPEPVSPVTMSWGPEGMRYANRWSVGMTYYAVEHDRLYAPRWTLGAAELPRGRERATAVGVGATLSLSTGAQDPEMAALALTLLADASSAQLLPSARRRSAAGLRSLEPRLPPAAAEAWSRSMEQSRALVLPRMESTAELHALLGARLGMIPARGGAGAEELAEAANTAVQQVLDRA